MILEACSICVSEIGSLVDKLIIYLGRLRVNMGNIYYKQGKYMQAVKMYRMALDQVPTTHELIRLVKIMEQTMMRMVVVMYVDVGVWQG